MNDFEKIKRLINWHKGMKISVEIKDIEGMVVEIDGWIALEPIEVEVFARGIKGGIVRKSLRWNVQALSWNHFDSNLPADVDITVVASRLTLEDACKKAWELLSASQIENILQDIEYAEMLEQDKLLIHSANSY